MFRSTRSLWSSVASAAASSGPSSAPAATIARKSTGLVGLPVHPTPRTALLSLYRETLAELKQCPADAAYTKSVAAITEQRLAVVEANEEAAAIEQRLDAGCIEEIIVQAEHELSLLKQMQEWKPWEPLEVKPAANQWVYFNQ